MLIKNYYCKFPFWWKNQNGPHLSSSQHTLPAIVLVVQPGTQSKGTCSKPNVTLLLVINIVEVIIKTHRFSILHVFGCHQNTTFVLSTECHLFWLIFSFENHNYLFLYRNIKLLFIFSLINRRIGLVLEKTINSSWKTAYVLDKICFIEKYLEREIIRR